MRPMRLFFQIQSKKEFEYDVSVCLSVCMYIRELDLGEDISIEFQAN